MLLSAFPGEGATTSIIFSKIGQNVKFLQLKHSSIQRNLLIIHLSHQNKLREGADDPLIMKWSQQLSH
jgi:hypothetical protein